MGAYANIDQALAGLQLGMMPRIDSAIAGEAIAFGSPVFGYLGDDGRVYGAHQDLGAGSFDADFVALNSISGSVTITPNGGASTVVSFGPVVFATDHATTMTALIAAINAALVAAGIAATASAGSTTRKINVTGLGIDVTAFAATVTLGASQAVFTATLGTAAKFKGIALFVQRGGRDYGAGSSAYQKQDAVNVLNIGYAWAIAAVAVKDLDAAYVIIAPGATQGQFTNVAGTNNYAINAYFRSSRNAQNLATVEVKSVA